MNNSPRRQNISAKFTIAFFIILAYSESIHSNYGEVQLDEVLFERFKLYIGYLNTNDLFNLNNISSKDIPFSEKQDNIDWGMPDKNENYIRKPYTTGWVNIVKSIWARAKYIYGFKIESINDKHKVLVLHSQRRMENINKKMNIKVRFYRESGQWKINEVEHTLETHNINEVFYVIDFYPE